MVGNEPEPTIDTEGNIETICMYNSEFGWMSLVCSPNNTGHPTYDSGQDMWLINEKPTSVRWSDDGRISDIPTGATLEDTIALTNNAISRLNDIVGILVASRLLTIKEETH